MRTNGIVVVLAVAIVAACGDDTGVGGGGGGGGANATAAGGDTATNSSSASVGGQGGTSEEVDPIDGVGEPQLIQDGFTFTEGTVWLPALGVLRFTDIPEDRIYEYDPASGSIEVWREPSANTNGNALAPNGDIVMCEHTGRRVSRSPGAGAPAPVDVASTYEGMQFNSPNDVIVRSDGTIYFTDPTDGLVGTQEIPFKGIFRVTPDGEVFLVDDAYAEPNGIALSPDETKLYASDATDGGVYVYDVAPDGTTGARALFLPVELCDGMAVDDAGNLYLATFAGIEVYKPDGTSWGTIEVPEWPANCAFGGADRKTLFITARTGLYSVVLNVPGKP